MQDKGHYHRDNITSSQIRLVKLLKSPGDHNRASLKGQRKFLRKGGIFRKRKRCRSVDYLCGKGWIITRSFSDGIDESEQR